ncbi:hypothetical protein LCGC14_0857140 [marine sediment metagenome]|uniref:Uncharacterized protein n=1 Tax=marine sediment metagenome TaxID=412755 RepID=A0A0F9SFH6_9ZZZZ
MRIQKWTKASNYMGEDMSEYYKGLARRPRAPNALMDSNFEMALELLGGESETVLVCSFGSWTGSFEQILVHESDEVAVAALEDVAERLAEYPVLDDEDHSEREDKATDVLWKELGLRERIEYLVKHEESIFAARTDNAYDLYHRAEQTYYYVQMLANEREDA